MNSIFEPLERREMLSVSPAVANVNKIKVKNLFDANGVSINQSLVSIPFSMGIRLVDASKIAVRGYAIDPLTGKQKKLPISTSDIHVDPTTTNYLIIHTDVLMRKNGGKILINDGALTDTKGRAISAMNLSSPKGQNKSASRSPIARLSRPSTTSSRKICTPTHPIPPTPARMCRRRRWRRISKLSWTRKWPRD